MDPCIGLRTDNKTRTHFPKNNRITVRIVVKNSFRSFKECQMFEWLGSNKHSHKYLLNECKWVKTNVLLNTLKLIVLRSFTMYFCWWFTSFWKLSYFVEIRNACFLIRLYMSWGQTSILYILLLINYVNPKYRFPYSLVFWLYYNYS